MDSRFILKLTGLVEVWWNSKREEIKDDVKHSFIKFCSYWKISL